MKPRHSDRATARRAFTLVEVLVVIGIIAVLVAILLPTLARAQASSKRVNCLSNLRQVHLTVQLYAMENRDQVPLGYRAQRKQFNSMVWSSTAKKWVLFGLMYKANHMRTPRVFFCPSEHNPQSMFNTPANPWPPGADGDPTVQGYAGYGFRPEVDIPDDLSTAPPTFAMPRLNRFRHRAILADLTATPERVTTRHERGVNVLYGHGGAKWVERKAFDAALRQSIGIAPTLNPFQDEIWLAFDRQ